MIKFTLDACKIIIVMVNSFWSCEVFLFDIDCGVSEAVALCPLLMALYARKGACES